MIYGTLMEIKLSLKVGSHPGDSASSTGVLFMGGW